MPVNEHISDIFFNTDVSSAKRYNLPPKSGFSHFDREKLEKEASRLLDSLSHFVVAAQMPTVKELVDDFLERV